jgi:hypothetical protein
MELDFAKSVIELVAAVLTLGAVIIPLFKKSTGSNFCRPQSIFNRPTGANHG